MNKYILYCSILSSLLIICFILLRTRKMNLKNSKLDSVSPYVMLGSLKNQSEKVVLVNVLSEKIPFLINSKESINNRSITKEQFEKMLEENNNKIPEDISLVILYCASWSCGAAHNYYDSLLQRNINANNIVDYKGALHEWAMYSMIMPSLFTMTNLSTNSDATNEELLELSKGTLHTYLLKDEKKSSNNSLVTYSSEGEAILNTI